MILKNAFVDINVSSLVQEFLLSMEKIRSSPSIPTLKSQEIIKGLVHARTRKLRLIQCWASCKLTASQLLFQLSRSLGRMDLYFWRLRSTVFASKRLCHSEGPAGELYGF